MSLHIQRFIDRIRASDSRGSMDFVMPMQDARNLQSDITELLLQLNSLQEQLLRHLETSDTLEVSVSGGGFK